MQLLLRSPQSPLPLTIQSESEDERALDALIAWCAAHPIQEHLHTSGGILFRGFQVRGELDFERLVAAISPTSLAYASGNSPRTKVTKNVYTSTEYPETETISLHNEMSYARTFPSSIFFHCAIAPRLGGETPIADGRRIFQRLSPGTRKRFVDKGVTYVQTYNDKGRGHGRSWQDSFETTERREVEGFCEREDIAYCWLPNGSLTTRRVRPAVIAHPVTGDEVWFNQVEQWHPSSLSPQMREIVMALGLVHDAYFGDGTPLSEVELDEIRQVSQSESVSFPWQEGDVLVLDNVLTLHGRRPFQGPRRILVVMS